MLLRNSGLKAQEEKAGSTRWHRLKGPFQYLFNPEDVPVVEDWYNLVAPQRLREAFRDVAKSINTASTFDPPADGSTTLEQHRASHMMQLYGHTLSDAGKSKARGWLLTASPELVDKFRDVFTALGKCLAVKTTTKESFVQRPMAVPVPKDRNRRKIDWNSAAVADKIRETTSNPMAGDRLPLIAGQLPKDSRRQSGKPASEPAAAASTDANANNENGIGEQLDVTFKALHDKQKQNLLERECTVLPDGCTVYQPKPRVAADTTRERIVTTIGNPASSWKSTTRDHIRNHGTVSREIVVADKHPAIARVTASLGLCVPTLQPKTVGPTGQHAKCRPC